MHDRIARADPRVIRHQVIGVKRSSAIDDTEDHQQEREAHNSELGEDLAALSMSRTGSRGHGPTRMIALPVIEIVRSDAGSGA